MLAAHPVSSRPWLDGRSRSLIAALLALVLLAGVAGIVQYANARDLSPAQRLECSAAWRAYDEVGASAWRSLQAGDLNAWERLSRMAIEEFDFLDTHCF